MPVYDDKNTDKLRFIFRRSGRSAEARRGEGREILIGQMKCNNFVQQGRSSSIVSLWETRNG
jgi:hypothetical protein